MPSIKLQVNSSLAKEHQVSNRGIAGLYWEVCQLNIKFAIYILGMKYDMNNVKFDLKESISLHVQRSLHKSCPLSILHPVIMTCARPLNCHVL